MIRYLQRTEDSMLTFQGSDDLCIIGYFDPSFAGCPDDMNLFRDVCLHLEVGLFRGKI